MTRSCGFSAAARRQVVASAAFARVPANAGAETFGIEASSVRRWCVAVVLAAATLAAVVPAGGWLAAERPPAALPDAGAELRSLASLPPQGEAGSQSIDLLPTQAQGVMSTALGRDDPQFAPKRTGGGFRLGGGGVAATFGNREVTVGARGERSSIGLSSIGRGGRLRPLGAVAPRTRSNRVTYRHQLGVTEWYAAGPLGVEQGFTVARSPVGGKGPLTLALAARGSLRARPSGSGAEFLTRSGRVALRYGGLTVLDASGRRLRAWLDVSSSGLLLRVADRRAQYPLQIDPFIQEGPKLLAPRSSFGYSVALSGDGNTALIGGPSNGTGLLSFLGPAPAAGAAWVFVRSGSTWTQQGPKLTASDESGDGWFGWSVALSRDGNTALIGGPTDDGPGAAWVYTRSGSTWTQQGSKLTGSGGIGSGLFGWSVALSGDGNTALIGDPVDNDRAGAAWVFTRSGSTWTQQGSKLTGSGNADFGSSVALSGDGSTALIGGPGDSDRVGAAWVFTRSGATWTQQGSKLTGSGEIGSGEFGWSVALSGDGNTGLIGGRSDNGGVGAAWVYTRSGATWTQQGSKLTGSGASGNGLFASSVALSSDGGTALIGGPRDNSTVGAAWVFTRTGSTWTQQGSKLTGSDPSGTGAAGWGGVALSADGSTALVGGHLDNTSVGAAWVYVRSGSTWAQQGSKLTPGSGENGSGELGSSVALSGDGNLALIGGPGDSNNVGAVWVFTRSNGVWTDHGPKLTGAGETGAGEFGATVSLSSDGNTALIGGPGDNGNRGAAWVFTRSGSTWTQQGSKLTGSDESGNGRFGSAVALSGDGGTALIGGSADNGAVGAAWVFTRSGSTWTQQGSKLTGAGETGAGQFGSSVALSRDGNVALAGGPFDNDRVGAAWVFTRSGSTWTQQGSKLTGADEIGTGRFGSAVALSGDGATALIGGPYDDALTGAAWVFTRSGSTWAQQGSKLTGSAAGLWFANSVALAADGNTALVGAYGDDSTAGAAWAFFRSGSTWSRQEPKLTPSDANTTGQSQFGYSVALSGDGRTALIGGPKDFGPFIFVAGSNSPPIAGAAWVFILGEAPEITSPPSATFRTGQPGSFTVAASGVPTPELTVGGSLPAGVQFEDNGDGTATLSGTPAAGSGGMYRFTVVAGNEVSADVQNFTLTVEQAPAITSAANATFATGQAGSFTVTSGGFPAAALSAQGALPAGVTFTGNGDGTATLAGTPAAGAGGVYRLTITAANGVSPNATQSFTLTVTQPPAITSAAEVTFATGQAGSFTVTSSGFPAPALSVQGALPAGVSFTDNRDGTATLAGTPAAGTVGVYRLTITAANGASSTATQELALRVGQAPAITSAAEARFTTGQAGSFTVAGTGSPTPALTARGTSPLPDGVSYTDNGDGTATLAGTPAAGTGGVYRLTITASNGVSPDATQEFVLTVGQPPAISPSGALFTIGRAESFTVVTSGFPAPVLSVQGTLPAGVSFTDNGDGTATLAGTAAAGTAGAYPLTITAANGVAPDATRVITLNIGQPPAITSEAEVTFTTGQAATFTITTSGFPAPVLFMQGALPDGVTFTRNSDGTATLAGTAAAGAGGVYPLTIIAGNGISPAARQDLTLTVEQPPGITSEAEVTFTTGQAATFTFTSSGFPTATLSVQGTLPAGVTFTDNGDGTATLEGEPDAGTGGVYPLTITAANDVSPVATQDFTVTVEQPPAIATAAAATFTTGQAASFTVRGSGFPVPALSVQGALPTGVTFTDNGDGTAALDGAPAAGTGGVYRLTITAANDIDPEATQEFTLTVLPLPQPPQPAGPQPPPPAVPSPAPSVLRLRALGLSVFGPAGSEARCRMRSELMRACTVRLVRGGRVLANGEARSGRGARGLTVVLELTKRGRALLAERLGGVRARLRAQALTSAGTRSASARTRALLRVERFTTPPGSWLPGAAALSERGERFLRSLRGRLVAVAALRCEGHSARLQDASAVATGPLSRARAALLCRALARRAGWPQTVVGRGTAEPIARNDTASGRAKNRRVVVTVTHRPRRLP